MEASTVVDMFKKRADASGPKPAYCIKKEGQWIPTTWDEFHRKAGEVALGLMAVGLQKGDTVSILGNTRPEWVICDMGVLCAGGVSVGIYQTNTAEQAEYIIRDSGSRVVFVEDQEQLNKILKVRGSLEGLTHIIVWEEYSAPEDGGVLSLNDLVEKGRQRSEELGHEMDRRQKGVKPDDTAILIYTSGTTGPPKGAIITHKNIMTELNALEKVLPMEEGDSTMAFLPMSHVAEHVVGFMHRVNMGAVAYYAESLDKLIENAQEVKPTVFGSVPRIFEKVHTRVSAGVASAKPMKRRIFNWAMKVGHEVSAHQQKKEAIPLGLKLKYKLADALVHRKLRNVFGGRVRVFVTGAAPTSLEILEFFHAAGMFIIEVYGLTECTGVSNSNTVDNFKFGTVGPAIPGAEVKLAEDGEILIRGDMVFKGYLNREEETREAIKDGWLYTGDIGVMDEDGFLRITDRKKNIIVTAGGKNITPSNIENLIKTDPLISQVLVHGDRRNFLSALITLDPEESVKIARERGIEFTDPAELAGHPDIIAAVQGAVDRASDHLSRVEQVKKFIILPRDFSVEGGEITPTLKVKRKDVEKKYRDALDKMYE